MRNVILYCAVLCQVIFWTSYRSGSNWHDFVFLGVSLVLGVWYFLMWRYNKT